jgi:hypothetical protein
MSLRTTATGAARRLLANLSLSTTPVWKRSFAKGAASNPMLRQSPSAVSSLTAQYQALSLHSLRAFATGTTGEKDTTDKSARSADEPASPHQEWVDFQRSIAVKGFETGQTTAVVRSSTRGGRRLRGRQSKEASKLEERLTERQRLTDIGGGEYPPLRYSDAETERLLAQAYAAVPERGGKRGTRNLKRQQNRWHLVRKIHKKYKKNMMRFQVRKMAERSRRIQSVKAALAEAPILCTADRAYQLQVFRRWAATMNPAQVVGGSFDGATKGMIGGGKEETASP